jgi:DNA-directed RNA polymerase subunit RPC12/RpoP
MPIDVKCPQCGSELEAPDNAAGKQVKCPDCGTRIPVAAGGTSPRNGPDTAIAAAPGAEAISRTLPPTRDGETPARARGKAGESSRPAPIRNGPARLASSCALVSLAPGVALVFGPLALLLGFVGLVAGRRKGVARATRDVAAALGIGLLTAGGNWGLLLYTASVLGVPEPVVEAFPAWFAHPIRDGLGIDDPPPLDVGDDPFDGLDDPLLDFPPGPGGPPPLPPLPGRAPFGGRDRGPPLVPAPGK